ATTLDSSLAGDITFASTLNSVPTETNSLVVNTSGTTRFNGAVGGVDRVSSVTTDAGGSTVINGGSVNTTGAQTYNDPVLLDSNTTVDSNGSGNVTFSSTLNSTAGELNSLLVNTSGATRFNGAVGGVDRLSSLTTDAARNTPLKS